MKCLLYRIAISIFLSVGVTAFGQRPVRFNSEGSDTTRINAILSRAVNTADPQQRVKNIGEEFIGCAYSAGSLDIDDKEIPTVNLDRFDCTTFVETVMALAITAGEGRQSWRDFVYNLERLRYRGGEANGYSSRLHYISDWIVDNSHRGTFDEVTNRADMVSYEVKTLDFMSANRNRYTRLADEDEFEKIKSVEIGYRSHRFPFIKAQNINKAAKSFLKEGDIIAVTTGKKGLDVAHMGILVFIDKKPHLMHASSKGGKVIVDPLPLQEYLRKSRSSTGIRVIRLKD